MLEGLWLLFLSSPWPLGGAAGVIVDRSEICQLIGGVMTSGSGFVGALVTHVLDFQGSVC